MNFELFIANRFTKVKQYKSSISSPIIKIAIVAIALGIIIMMIAIATGVGLQNKIREKLSGLNGHIQITNFDNNNSEITLVPLSIEQGFYPEFSDVPEITHIQPYATKAGIIRTENDFEGILLKGITSDYDLSFFKNYLVEGKLPVYDESKSNEIVLSKYITDRLQLKLGDEFNTFFLKNDINRPPSVRVFKLVGIYNSGFHEFDANLMLCDIKVVQKLNKWKKNEVGGFELYVDDFDKISEIGEVVYHSIPPELNSTTIIEKFPGIFEWIRLFDTNIVVIIVIMVFVAGINMITALLVLILEKTQMIGVLKALGATNSSIRTIFLYKSSFLIMRGLFWGNLIGLGLLFLQKQFKLITLNPETYYVRVAPVYLDWSYILLLNIGTLLLCLVMLILPSWIITRVKPVKAIKFD